ncbi:MAG: GNAT family N-acetyltransferase [Aliifodinibius sp.]|nr:GNAT family N-acetyltransferase [Fodinibius sp.]NIW47057.1 GNAT family N-acetyltransferase [Gammaproteobacteria bacterium]NIX00616.1 GNAT family N-acetyltransferase [Phycisphaerae bacterium]NIY28154.1 GNAT family N-acetyltransferase [Fodinibius sp.]
MIQCNPYQTLALRERFEPEKLSWFVGTHLINTGNGACFVDRWPNPRAVLVDVAGNYSLSGDPDALKPYDLQDRIIGFIDAPKKFYPLLKETFSDVITWDRVIYQMDERPNLNLDHEVHKLGESHKHCLWGLTPESNWISKTWGGPSGLVSSGYAWGAFVDSQLVSVACTFFLGNQYEEIGVVTESEYRGRGFAAACAAKLSKEIQFRRHIPTWSTSTDNEASIRVAEKLGFKFKSKGMLYVVGIEIPRVP